MKSEIVSASEILTPSQLASLIAAKVAEIGSGTVEGEITGLSSSVNEHRYFTLADEDIGINCICFRGRWSRLDWEPTDGTRVRVAFESVEYYKAYKKTGIIVTTIEPVGVGEILRRIEETKARLSAEGIRNRLRPPRFPRVIGLITGNEAKARSDVVEGVRARFPGAKFDFRSATVQGINCVPEVIDALGSLAQAPKIDVIVIARGGGSIEDLAPFSDERLCRAIAALGLPVVVAIGHEDDAPACHITASAWAPVPHKVGLLVVPSLDELRTDLNRAAEAFERASRAPAEMRDRLGSLTHRLEGRTDFRVQKLRLQVTTGKLTEALAMQRALRLRLSQSQGALGEALDELLTSNRSRLASYERSLAKAIETFFVQRRLHLDAARTAFEASARELPSSRDLDRHSEAVRQSAIRARREITTRRERLDLHGGALLSRSQRALRAARDGLGRRAELLDARDWIRRGFALVTRPDGTIVKHADEVTIGDQLLIGLSGGEVRATTDEVIPERERMASDVSD